MECFLLRAVLGLALLCTGIGAEACRVRPRGILPLQGDEAAVLATVVSHAEHSAEARFDEVLDGHVQGRSATLSFAGGLGEVVVTCAPPGPRVQTGARVIVVFGHNGGRQYLRGWTTLDSAAATDDFFALYQRARRPTEKRLLLTRWRQVNRYRGPVPLSDPEHWLARHVGGLGWIGPDGWAYVSFQVADDGRIAGCDVHGVRAPARSATICHGIRNRRFARPLFARERYGMFRVRWRDPAGNQP